MTELSRRKVLAGCGAMAGMSCAGAMTPQPASAAASVGQGGFRFCLNSGTLQGYKLNLVEFIEIAAKAGYRAIEPWISVINAYVREGGSLPDLRKRVSDLGLTVENAIGFAQWIVDDPAKRAKNLEQARRDMDLVAGIGGKRIAAPPAGATTAPELGLDRIVERYRALLEIGDQAGVVPVLELWGRSANLHRLVQVVFVAMETGHPKACVLPDVFHLYAGGSGFQGLRLLSAQAVPVFHLNDYPANPPRETIADRDRVYPGDGIGPMKQILGDLHRTNPAMVLSLEVFNPAYWKGDPLESAKTGLAKMRQVAREAATA